VSPARLYRIVARAEAVTWALLLTGMFLKYVTHTTELGVRVGGMAHGVVFIAYCLVTGLLWVDQKWSVGRFLGGLACAVPPFATIPFELSVERRGLVADAWRLRTEAPSGALEKLVSWLVRRPAQGALAGIVAVGALTGVALVVGPPAG
jgi:integral membrane protein